ncbi:hypothetical protein ACQRXC_08850 [Niallia taxi]|uniref:hypothetical protein n=1 Tax=Niallia taxi TaxID=2499688 RepID=UPI003F5EE7CC
MNTNSIEKLLWSIALPGFGQLLNKKYMKGTILIALEFLVNVQSNFNVAIVSSFHGNIPLSLEQIHLKWLMFYPCLYFFSMWDAVKDADEKGENHPLLFLPFVFSAYFVTTGLIYSSEFKLFGHLIGPIFLPIFFVIPGVTIGFGISKLITILKRHHL